MPTAARRPQHRRGAVRTGRRPVAAALALAVLLLCLAGGNGDRGAEAPALDRSLDVQLAAANNPSAPTGLRVVTEHRSLTVSWSPTSRGDNPQHYTVFLRRGSTLVTSRDTPNESTTSMLFNGLDNCVTGCVPYSVTVRVTTSYWGGLFIGTVYKDSPESSAVQARPLPSAPTGLVAAPGDNSVTLTWNKNPEPTAEVTKYSVYRGGTRVAQVPTSSASTTSYRDSGLVNRTAVGYTVTAVDANGAESNPAAVTAAPVDEVKPSPVTGLRSEWTEDGSGQTRLFWTPSASPDAVRQRVVRNGSVVAELPASATSYTDVGEIEVRQTYSISVVDDDGLVSENDPTTSEIPRDWMAPAVPSGLVAAAGDGRVALSWAANTESDLASYRVLRDGTEVAVVDAPATSFTDTGLTNDVGYAYTLRSVDRRGNTSDASSPAVTATPLDMTAPAVPTGLVAVRGDGQVSLTWTAGTEADLAGYDLFRRTDGATSSVRVSGAVLGPTATSFTDAGLTNDVRYTYTLRAHDRAGNSSASSAGASATPTDLTPPAVPARPSAVAGDGVVSLSWAPSSESDLASYQVLRDGAVIAAVAQPTTTYTDRAVTNGRSYDYALKAVDTHDNASAATTPVVTATPRDLTPPAVPAGLTATRGDTRVVLSWTANTETDLASYRVLRGGVVVATVTAPTTTYTDTGLTNDTPYDYSLAAYDAVGNGSAASSPVVTATPTDLTAPAAPAGVTSTPGDGEVLVTWTANTEPDLASYHVHRGGQLVATIAVVAPPGTTPTSYRDSGLANGTARTYTVTAVDTHGNESPTSTTSATPADTTAPGAPGTPTTTPSDRQVTITWTASPAGDVATYRVLRDGAEVISLPATARSYTDTGLVNGHPYAYTVVAVDTAGNRSTASGTGSATPRDSTPPGAPTAVSATPGSGSATVRWTAPPDTDLATYRVLRSDGGPETTVTAPATSAVVTGLTNGTAVTLTVVVVDTSGNTSPASSPVTATPAASFSGAGAGTSGALAVSADGRWLVVSTAAPLEDSADANGSEELYRVDTTGATSPRRVAPLRTRGSLVTDSTQTSEVALSSNGRFVVLATADALVDSDQNGQLDVYRADMNTSPPTYALVSVPGSTSGRTAGLAHVSTAGTLVQSTSTVQTKVPGLAVSSDGSRVLFYSSRTDLLASGSTTGVGVFAKDLTGSDPSRGPVALVSTDTGGGALTRTPTGPALAITPDGRYAVFTATSSSSGYAVLRKDLGSTTAAAASSAGELVLVSSTPPVAGQQSEVGAGRDTGQVSVSTDGRLVAFLSTAQLTSSRPRNTGTTSTAYVKDVVTGAVTAIGSPSSGVEEEQVSLSPDGATATFTTAAPLVSGDRNAKPDAYRRDLASGALSLVTSDGAGAGTPSVVGAAYRGRVVDLGGPQVVVLTVQALDPADTNRVRDVYLKDLATGAVTSLVRP